MARPGPLCTDRIRNLERPFGWIPFRILTGGFLEEMNPPAKLLYFFLCLVADRYGVSFYSDRRIDAFLGMDEHTLALARAELCQQELLAFDGRIYQLLSLPARQPKRARPAPMKTDQGPTQLGRILKRIQKGI